jgi:hypothetical protein
MGAFFEFIRKANIRTPKKQGKANFHPDDTIKKKRYN